VNLASWHRHGRAALEEAARLRVNVLLGQEAGISQQVAAGATSAARAMGWQLLVASMPSGRVAHAGVFLAVREPLVAVARRVEVEQDCRDPGLQRPRGALRGLVVPTACRGLEESPA
jgi:hypothetical protein